MNLRHSKCPFSVFIRVLYLQIYITAEPSLRRWIPMTTAGSADPRVNPDCSHCTTSQMWVGLNGFFWPVWNSIRYFIRWLERSVVFHQHLLRFLYWCFWLQLYRGNKNSHEASLVAACCFRYIKYDPESPVGQTIFSLSRVTTHLKIEGLGLDFLEAYHRGSYFIFCLGNGEVNSRNVPVPK